MSANLLAVSRCKALGIPDDYIGSILEAVRICCEDDLCMKVTYSGIEKEWAWRRGWMANDAGVPTHECPYYGEDDDLLKSWFEGYFGKDWESILTDQYSGEYALSKDQINDELPDKFFDEMSYNATKWDGYSKLWDAVANTEVIDYNSSTDEFKDGE